MEMKNQKKAKLHGCRLIVGSDGKTTKLYICGVCNKGFISGQALGGHVRIHIPKKVKKDEVEELPRKRRIANIQPKKVGLDMSSLLQWGATDRRSGQKRAHHMSEEEYKMDKKIRKVNTIIPEGGSNNIESGNKEEILMTPPAKSYVCRDCQKTFSTHQALGGHRSGHAKANRKSGETTRQEEEASPTGGKISPYDLNKIPDIEEASPTGGKISPFDLNMIPDIEEASPIGGKSFWFDLNKIPEIEEDY